MTRHLLLLLVLLSIISGCREENPARDASEQAPPPLLPVEVITVAKELVPIWIEYTGKTEASKRVEVRARVAGRLEKFFFDEGAYVQKGQKLFEIEQDSYQAALSQARAQLNRTLATLELAKKDVERYRPLVAEDLAPRVTLEQYEAKVAELEAVVDADRATIRTAELNLSYTEVVAPIAGKISRRAVDVGNIVGYGEKTILTTIVSDDPMYAYFNPTESQFQIMRTLKVQDQMAARVTIPESGEGLLTREPLSGKVDFTDNRIDRMTGTITMRAAVANPEGMLLEGTFVYVEVMITDQVSFLMIPPGVVQNDQRGSYVYVVDETGSSKRVDIVRGYESRHYLLVKEGLEGGETVIASGLAKIGPGTKVKPTDVTDEKGVMALLTRAGMVPDKE